MAYKAAMVVAHPDDETLWGAGWILANATDEFTVICCSTPKRDPVRADKFRDACAVLRATPWQCYAVDRGGHAPLDLRGLPDLMQFDYVVTHNHMGEYGNPHHVQVNHYVREHFQGRPTYCFGRGLNHASSFTLSDEQAARKLEALKCYSHVSSADGMPKWRALIDRYFDGDVNKLAEESYTKGIR